MEKFDKQYSGLGRKRLCGSDICKHWRCYFPIDKINIKVSDSNYKVAPITDCRIEQLSKRIDIKGKRILELGCLEEVHSFMLQILGVGEVIAIEGRRENFLKSLIVKNTFNLDKCKFLFGDLNTILPILSDPFDLCLALGILYHLKNSVAIIYRIAELADSIFVWTHYATNDYPEGSASEVIHKHHTYCGKYIREDNKHYLSGLQKNSFWIFEEDFLRVVKDTGFKNIDLIQKEKHGHGLAMTFLARK